MMHSAIRFGAAAVLTLFASGFASAGNYSFQALGNLSGSTATSYNSSAAAVSADGSHVTGSIAVTGSPRQAFLWTASTGVVGLGHLPGNTSGAGAHALSGDGSIVVGEDGSFPPLGFRWTSGGGMVSLGDLAGGDTATSGQGISADGSIIVGIGSSSNGLEAFRYTAATNMVGLGALAGGSFNSEALAISADGSTIVGTSNSTPGTQAFMWTSGGGMVGIGDLAGGAFNSTALAVSGNGSVIVGNGTSANGTEAFRWTATDQMVGLGYLSPSVSGSSYARGISYDGSTIIGDSNGAAFLWTSATGMINIKSLLLANGITGVNGWSLSVGAGISADGRTLVGTGFSPDGRSEAWIATIPEPSTAVLGFAGISGLLALKLGVAGARRYRRRRAEPPAG